MNTYDVLVIGAGPGGYVAAIRAAQLGLRTACVDAWLDPEGKPVLGGTCLNVGCIPSKALLESTERYAGLADLAGHGIDVGPATIDVPRMQARKQQVVAQLTAGIAGLLRKQKVSWLKGQARLLGGGEVDIAGPQGAARVKASHIVIATGSVPIDIPAAPLDGVRVVDSAGALAFDAVPATLGVIGAGAIGLELGSVWARLGSQVTVLEALPDFLPSADRAIAGAALKDLRAQGLDIRLGARVQEGVVKGDGVAVRYEDAQGTHTLEVQRLVVAVGRRAYTDGLGLDAVGIAPDARGRIPVDAGFRTAADGIYAIGDVTAGPMLAHKASEEGVAVAECIAGQAGHVNHDLIPAVIYTHPEIAWVGRSEQALTEAGVPVRSGSFPFAASGRARAAGATQGLVKILAHAETDRVLGVHIYGAHASELIAEAVLAMAYQASAEDIARTIHAHPTLAEAVHEAALAVGGRAIHI